jgi:hypothetical protein
VLGLFVVLLGHVPRTALAQVQVEGATVLGIKRTRPSTVLDLLPREPPSEYTDAELKETERRVSNLYIFDKVSVTRSDDRVVFDLREKWTLIPDVAFATGKTIDDLYISLGASEYNLFGMASTLSLNVYREQRGFGFGVLFKEHESRCDRWAFGGLGNYYTTSTRFDDGNAWYTTIGEFGLSATSTPLVGDHLRARTSFTFAHETLSDVEGPVRPPNGSELKLGGELVWDSYRFHDLVPSGFGIALGAGPGIFLPAKQPRAYAELGTRGALPLARYTVFTGRVEAVWTSRGNVNHSSLLGSIEGVRGLADAFYRNWAQVFTNLELRQALPLFDRLALQLVAFADAGVFAELDARGQHRATRGAFSGGLGGRLVPTFLAQLLFRVDVARLVVPHQDWFVQFGLSQYF